MDKNTVTLVLNGKVYLEDLAAAVAGWKRLMGVLSDQESPKSPPHWIVDELSAGSFFATLLAVRNGADPASIERIVTNYQDVGHRIRHGGLSKYNHDVQDAAREIVGVIGSRVTSVRFETEEMDTEIYSPAIENLTGNDQTSSAEPPRQDVGLIPSLGAVRGRVQTVSNRRGLHFMLYETNTDRSVTCYINVNSGMTEEELRNAFGKLAVVEGIVRRDSVTGYATTIRQVDNVEVISPLDRGAWRKLRGIAPATNSISPEDAVRAVRNG